MGRASRLAAAIENRFAVLPKLIAGHNAVFDVSEEDIDALFDAA